MSTAAASDPFESTANPAHYVARPACEQLLATLEQRVRQGTHPVALSGPAGFGKTFLLQVLGERLRGTFRVVGLPYPALSGEDLCRWVLDSLGAAAGDDPEGSLLDFAFRTASEHGEILILVDDASALPPGTARSLATLVSASGGALRAVFAAGDDARLGPAIAALGPDLQEIRFETPMTVEETAAYLRGRLADASDPARAARFDEDTIARLHGATGGIPRRVHELGSLVWRLDRADGIPYVIERWAREDEGRDEEPADERLETNGGAAPDAEEVAGEAALLAAAAALEPREPPQAERETPRAERAIPAAAASPVASEASVAPPAVGVGDDLPDLDLLPPEELEPLPRPPEPLPRPPEPPARRPEPAPARASVPLPVLRDSGRGRTRGVWVAVVALAAIAIAMPYLLRTIEDLLPGEAPERPRVRVGPAAVPPAPDEDFAAVEQPVPPRPESEPGSGVPSTPEPPPEPAAAAARKVASPEPAGAPLPLATPSPALVAEPSSALVAEPKPAPPEPVVARRPAPLAEPVAVVTPEPAPKPVVLAPEPRPEPVAVRMPESAPEPVAVRMPEPAPEPVAVRMPEPAPEPVAVRTPAPAQEPVAVRTPEPALIEVAAPEPARAAAPAPSPAPKPRPRARGPAPVMVNVHAIPWATIHVDGGVVGETPLVSLPLSPGLHVFRAEFPGGRAVVRTIEISSENRHVSFE